MFLFAVAAGIVSTYLYGLIAENREQSFVVGSRTGHDDTKEKVPELSEYFRYFMLPNDETDPEWSIGTGKNELLITWITAGVDYDGYPDFSAYRKALARIAINEGEIRILKDDMRPLKWELILRGNKFGPVRLEFSPDKECFDPTATGCSYEIESILKRSNLNYQLLCKKDEPGWYRKVYLISGPGLRSAYLVHHDHEGSGGRSSDSHFYWFDPAELMGKPDTCIWFNESGGY